MIPFGLGVLGFGLSYLIAYSNSKPYKQRRAGGVGPSKTVGGANTNTQRQGAMLNQSKLATRKDTYDKNNERFDRRSTSMNPNVSNDDIRLSEIEMTDWLLFDSNDTFLIKVKKIIEKINSIRTETILGKCISLLFKISLVVFVGAMFFKFHKPEVERLELTWIDALYFGTVTATSIGYGDITAQSDGGKIFLCFYMLISTILMADSLGDFIDLYVSDIVGEAIIDEIIDSTIWVHKCDLDMDGKVSEADYVLFKLQQMQKVDASMMDVLIDRYHDLDVDGEGALDVGIDIPSAEQVKTMQELKDNTETPRTLTELWKDMQLALRRKRTESRSSSMGQENPTRSSVEFDEDTMQPHVGSGFEDNKDDMRDAQISAPSNIEMIELQIEEKTIVN
jgi:hypothetical protein